MNEMLFDWPFKIQMYNRRWNLIFATVSYDWEECTIRFKWKNLTKVIEFVREWYRDKQKNSDEYYPLKQYLKCNRDLFLW